MLPLQLIPLADRRLGVISVTLPSRRRPEMLTASIASLREQAAHPELLEVLVAHDPDDPETAQTAKVLGADVIWEAPERYGYPGLAHYYTGLLDQVTGEWVLPTWGDDGLMQTRGWDDIVRAQLSCSVIYPEDNFPGWVCFPIVHMDVFYVLGRFCPLPATDSWYELVAREAGIAVTPEPGITVLQDRFDLTGHNDDQTYQESRSGYRPTEFFSEPYVTWRAEDAAALRNYHQVGA
jgi:glycosyltransferase involved in cell wall biosynthesis